MLKSKVTEQDLYILLRIIFKVCTYRSKANNNVSVTTTLLCYSIVNNCKSLFLNKYLLQNQAITIKHTEYNLLTLIVTFSIEEYLKIISWWIIPPVVVINRLLIGLSILFLYSSPFKKFFLIIWPKCSRFHIKRWS